MSAPGDVVMLVSPSATPCGVESFARELSRAASACQLAVSGRAGDWLRLWSGLRGARALVVNLPVVAWKRALTTPLAALRIAGWRGAQRVVVMHEWEDLQPARRRVYSLYLREADVLLFSSPHVRKGFLRTRRFAGPTGLLPIPANIAPPAIRRASRASLRLEEERRAGKTILGHFGSIYPKKNSDFVLDIAAALRARGREVFVAFIGSIIQGSDNGEAAFRAKARRLDLEGSLLVTGYVESAEEIFALFDACDAFVYAFNEGLTSRRGSVLACLQSGKPVVVNAPVGLEEFAHHAVYRERLASGALVFVPNQSEASDYARALDIAISETPPPPAQVYETGWREAAQALRDGIS